jgi:uncharacterized membrane protein YedE/YeeE
MSLVYGLVTGILFGVLFQKARVPRYDKQVGALRLIDMTIFKFMLSAVIVGMVGVYLLKDLGLLKLSVKPLVLGDNIIGGLIFGIGWGIAGYCPTTSSAAVGEGRLDALWAAIGMLVGAGLFAEFYPALKASVGTWGAYGKITLPEALGVNHWIIIPILIAAYAVVLYFFEKKGL